MCKKKINYLPFNREKFTELYKAIRNLPKYYKLKCDCGHCSDHLIVNYHAVCPECAKKYRIRAFGAYDEVEDLMSILLNWLGKGVERDKILSEFDIINTDCSWDEWDEYFEEDKEGQKKET